MKPDPRITTVVGMGIAILFLQISLAEDRAPVLKLSDHKGKVHDLRSYRGRILVVNFWATWCKGCVEEMPIFKELSKQFGKKLSVIAVSLDDKETQADIDPFIQKVGIRFPVLVGATTRHLKEFGFGESLPDTAILDARGRIVRRIEGLVTREEMFSQIEAMLANEGASKARHYHQIPRQKNKVTCNETSSLCSGRKVGDDFSASSQDLCLSSLLVQVS